MEPVKLGIIGCGIAARDLHWPALKQLKSKFQITLVCNHTEPKAKSFAELVGGEPYVLDYKKLLDRDDVEAINIILPIDLNYRSAKDALATGKHVIIEKPLAASVEQAEELVRLAEKSGAVTMVAENFRFSPIFLRAKELLDRDLIGKPYMVINNGFGYVDPAGKYSSTKWRIDHKYPGGFVTDGGVHNVAVLRMLFGELTPVSCMTQCVNPSIGRVDSMNLQFKTEAGVHGVLNIFFSSVGYSESRFIILGDKGVIEIGREDIEIRNNNTILHKEKFPEDRGYKGEFEAFYSSIRTGTPSTSSFEEGYKDLKFLLDAYKKQPQ